MPTIRNAATACKTAHAHSGITPGNIALTARAQVEVIAAPKTKVAISRYATK
jgi:hypothetical protein